MAFVQDPIPTFSQAQMLAQLPPVGGLYFFYNSDQDDNLYSVDSAGTFTFVSDSDDDCCTCELSESWLCALNDALATGLITQAQYQASISAGLVITSTNSSSGCSITVGTKIVFPTSVTIAPRPTTLAVGANLQLGISSLPSGSDPSVFWVSADPTKLTVDQTGLLHGVAAAPGGTKITVYSKFDPTVSDNITVVTA